ncbi:hypothetical protein HDU87_008635 [Geranomyces variabilis]|uniref:N-acetyltransferase domain-containing protein n=1 Tax=Geranomyces variabilis TaxID=109894 RepID=A0AAD5TDX9_9FUNG|nr:hypothetical protein HDU87_008635 [Geranomyces variabilis]
MSSAYGTLAAPRPNTATPPLPLPIHVTLKDGSPARVTRFDVNGDAPLLDSLHALMNAEIAAGNTYPQEELLSEQGFQQYFLSNDAFVVKRRTKTEQEDSGKEEALGMFYIKPNFPGRCSHICNGGFIVGAGARGLGVGRAMGEAFLKLVPLLGYRAAMFNLVFKTNVPSVNLWKSLGFETIGVIPKAGRLRIDGKEEYVDALTMYYDFCK